jgi:peptidyl-prolyl cis-trans isomerase SurA
MHAIIAHLRAAGFMLAAALLLNAGAPAPAHAQSLVATVNDSPITTYDIEQRVRLLRVLRQPASPAAALESIVEDRLKASETRKYGINPTNQDASQELARIASTRKIPPTSLAPALQSARVDAQHWQEHGKAQIGWRGYIAALNKNVGVSETDVRAELNRRGGAKAQEYILRPIVFIVPRNAGAGQADARAREAASLRTRFSDCDSGLQFARALQDVAIRPSVTRTLSSLPQQMAQTIEKTPVGRLTPPVRSGDGYEMIAVCGKGRAGSDSSAAEEIRQELISKRMEATSDKLYAALRKRAIIVKR